MKAERDLEAELQDEKAKGRGVTDLFRKVVVSGMGALFMTEEGIRSAVKELKLPKEVLAGALAQAERTKAEVLRIVGAEVRSFLESVNLEEMLVDALTRMQWDVRARVAFERRDDGLAAPVVDATVRVKRRPSRRRKPSNDEGGKESP